MKTELKNIGAWGRLHYDLLYRNNRTVINVMWLNGTLNNKVCNIFKKYYFRICDFSHFNYLKEQIASFVIKSFVWTCNREWLTREPGSENIKMRNLIFVDGTNISLY